MWPVKVNWANRRPFCFGLSLLWYTVIDFVVVFQGSRWLEKFLLLGSRSQVYGFLSHRSPLQDQTDLISYSYIFPKNELCTWHYFSFNIIQVSFNVCHIFVSHWPCTLRWHYCISNLLLHCKFLDRNNKLLLSFFAW